MVDARYRNKKNGKIAVITQEDPKFKTAMLEYEDDGREQQVSFSTLKRWWEEIDDDEEVLDDEEDYEDDDEFEDYPDDVEDDEEEFDEEEDDAEEDEDALDEDGDDEEEEAEDDLDDVEEAEEDETAGDGTPLKEVGKEIAAQAKKKAEAAKKESSKAKTSSTPAKKERKKAEVNPDVEKILGYIEVFSKKHGGEILTHVGGSNGCFKVNGRRFVKYRLTNKMVKLYFKDDVTKKAEKPKRIVKNEVFNAEYEFITADKDTNKRLDTLLKLAIDAQKAASSTNDTKKAPVAEKAKKAAPASSKKASKKGGK